MIYITGDMHGNINQAKKVFEKINNKTKNILIVLGDFCGNYYLDKRDDIFKTEICKNNVKLFVIRGNHDANPVKVENISKINLYGNEGYIQPQYPNIFYAKNGLVYNIEGNNFLVLGGAYSVDKWYRLKCGYAWFNDEQMTIEEQNSFLNHYPNKVDVILSHTCPYSNIPRHLFLSQIDQSSVDNNMEKFLEEVKNKVKYEKWFFGHYHSNELIEENMYMLYDGVIHYKKYGKLRIY